jgi:hypothetical protein
MPVISATQKAKIRRTSMVKKLVRPYLTKTSQAWWHTLAISAKQR